MCVRVRVSEQPTLTRGALISIDFAVDRIHPQPPPLPTQDLLETQMSSEMVHTGCTTVFRLLYDSVICLLNLSMCTFQGA